MHRQNAHGMALAGRHALRGPSDAPVKPASLQSAYPCGVQGSESASISEPCRRRDAHRPIPCEPPSSADRSGEVGEHCLSLAQRGELRSRPTDRAAKGTLREAQGGEPGSPSLVTFLASKKVTRLPGETGAAVRASKCVDVLRLLYATLSTNGSRCVDVLRLRCAALSTNGYLWEIRSRR